MFRVFIDTCVWFDIAEDPKRFPELAAVELLVRRELMQLIVPRLAIREFHKKRENIAQTSETSLLPHIEALREAAMKAGGHKKKVEAFLAHLEEIATHVPIEGGGAAQALDRIERLLSSAPVIEESEAVVSAAVQRGLDRRAPFRDRNSMADSILIETYAQCVREATDDARFLFVTHNKQDFSLMQGNHNLPHPHLADIFPADKSDYFIDLVAALKRIEPTLVAELLTRDQPTLGEVITQYLHTNPSIGHSRFLLRKLAGADIAKKRVSKLRPHDFVEHARMRRNSVSGASVNVDFVCFKGALVWAQANLSADVSPDVVDRAKRTALKEGLIAKSKQMPVKRLSREDERRFVEELSKRTGRRWARIDMVAVFQFALWSARRRKEICHLRWEDFNRDSTSCWVRDINKQEKKLRFPLLGRALEVVLRQQEITGGGKRIFPYNPESVGKAFIDVKNKLKIDFTFNDLRDEGIRRLLEAREYPIELILQLDRQKVLDIKEQMEAGSVVA